MDKKINIVETDVWVPDEKPGYLRYVGQRKMEDVFQDLNAYLTQRDMLPDEYFLPNSLTEKGSLFPKDARIIAYADYGGNEGVYLDVDLITEKGIEHLPPERR